MANELKQTRRMIAQMQARASSEKASLNSVSAAERLTRAERYARWRRREFLAGRVARL